MKTLFSGITVKGFTAVLLMTIGAFTVVGGIAVIILGAIEGNLNIGLWGVLSVVIGVISGKAGSWIYDKEDMDEEI